MVHTVHSENPMNNINHIQTLDNNPNAWRDMLHSEHDNQNKQPLNNKRPVSLIQTKKAAMLHQIK